MNKSVKENIKKNVELIRLELKLSDDECREIFGNTKEAGINNILNAIIKDLEK